MSTIAVAMAEIAALKARVDALEAGGGGASSSSSGSSGDVRREDAFPDSMLEKPWADKSITKDPKKWKGATQVGRKYSRAPAEWLKLAAESFEYKAHMGRKEEPVRCRNDGKPWHESDTFEAKLLRAWAERNANKKPAKSESADDGFGGGTSKPPVDDFGDYGSSDSEIPF